MRLAFLLVAVLCGRAWAALDYARFAPPAGDYALDYPASWKRSFGLQALFLQPPAHSDASVRVSIERFPVGKDSPATPADFIKGLMAQVGRIKRLDSRAPVMISGVKAERIVLTETTAHPASEVFLIVPRGKSYYVVSMTGAGPAFAGTLPEFQRLTDSLRFPAR